MIELICTLNDIKYKLSVDDSILITYQQSDFSSPEAIKNSYTKTIELEGTKDNISFFELAYRFDRRNSMFDPTKKVDCIILSNGVLIDRGYIVLDTVDRKNNDITFNITFYSSLGQFLYNLTTNEDGESVYLSDLYYGFPTTDFKYTLTEDQETEDTTLFTLNSQYIFDSWSALADLGMDWTKQKSKLSLKNKLYCNIVPVPCYSGYSDNIDTENAIVIDPSANTIKKFEATDSVLNGIYKAELAREMDEWEVSDLRSAEQHLGVRWSFILDAMFDPANNGGYKVNFPYKNDNNSFVGRYYNNGFVILPKINNEEDDINLSDSEELNGSANTFKVNTLGEVKIKPTIDTSNWTNVILDLDVYTTWKVRSKIKGIDNCYTSFKYWTEHDWSRGVSAKDLNIVNFLGLWVSYRSVDGTYKKKYFALLSSPIIESTVKDNDGNEVTHSEHLALKLCDEFRTAIKAYYWTQAKNANNYWGRVYRCLENPVVFDSSIVAGTTQDTNVGTDTDPLYQTEFQNNKALRLFIEDIHKTDLDITVSYEFFETGYERESYSNGATKRYNIFDLTNASGILWAYNHTIGYGTATSSGYISKENTGYLAEGKWYYLNDSNSDYYSSIYNTTSTDLPTNNITKKLLFGSDHTAADFLLQFVKQCNLRIKYNKLKNQIDILTLQDYYKDETVDITTWVDKNNQIELNYNYYDFNRLTFGYNNSVGSESESYPEYLYYKKKKGSMNNYTFNTNNNTVDDSSEYLSDSILDSTVDYCMKSQWFSSESKSMLLKGAKCTLISFNSDSLEELDTSEYTKQWNLQTKYLDCVPKLALFDKDNSGLDGYFTGFFGGFVQLKYPVQISDNIPLMKQLNDDCCYIYWLDKVLDGTKPTEEGKVTGIVRLNPTQTGTIGYQTTSIPLFTMNDYYSEDKEAAAWYIAETTGSKQADLKTIEEIDLHPIYGLWWNKPDILYSNSVLPNRDLYDACFGNYISDIYDNNTFVVTMSVRIPVGTNLDELFRKFIWYENSLFVLNKVTDYNVSTDGVTEIEMIKVQDKYHYL